jgi:hypothetical protein
VPSYGEAAVSTSGTFGHVAFVESVNASNSTMVISEYNYDMLGDGDTRTVSTKPGGEFTEYVNFGLSAPPTTTPGPGPGATGGGNLAKNGGFEIGGGSWAAMPSTNWVVYANGQVAGEQARSGSHYGATNTSAGGGGIYQDITGLTISPGDTFCASAFLRTQYPATGAAGSFALWLLGGSNENGAVGYGALGNQNNWTESKTCVTATSPHSAIRIQMYPNANSPTVDIDDVDVH